MDPYLLVLWSKRISEVDLKPVIVLHDTNKASAREESTNSLLTFPSHTCLECSNPTRIYSPPLRVDTDLALHK